MSSTERLNGRILIEATIDNAGEQSGFRAVRFIMGQLYEKAVSLGIVFVSNIYLFA